jgi:hypothetical protein
MLEQVKEVSIQQLLIAILLSESLRRFKKSLKSLTLGANLGVFQWLKTRGLILLGHHLEERVLRLGECIHERIGGVVKVRIALPVRMLGRG